MSTIVTRAGKGSELTHNEVDANFNNLNTDKIQTFATTTDILTGTSTTAAANPDSVAALWEQGSDVASAGTTSLGEGGYFNITGTTTITDIDFATTKAGRQVWIKFAGILTLTHNATTLILPTGASIVTAAGDTACFISEGGDNVRCVAYHRASGKALFPAVGSLVLAAHESSTSTTPALIADANGDWTIPVVNGKRYRIQMYGSYTSAAGTTGCILNMTAVTASGTIRGRAAGAVVNTAASSELAIQIIALPWSLTTTGMTAAGESFVGFDLAFVCNNTGSLEVRWATEVAASAADLRAGSVLMWEEF